MMDRMIGFFKSLNERELLLLLLGITFGLRLYAVLMAQGIAPDGAAYGFVARDFLRGHFTKGLSSPAPPFYPFLIFLLSPNTAHVEIAGRLISLFFGTLAVIPLFYLVKAAIGQKVAVFSTLLYSFHPYLVTYSGMLFTEATYWGLLILSVYFFWTGIREEKLWRAALAGGFLGLCYLTRPEGIGYLFVYVIWVGVEGLIHRSWFKKFAFTGVLILSAFIFAVPYVLHIHQETGQWLISKKAVETQSQVFEKDAGGVNSLRGPEQNNLATGKSKVQSISETIVHFFPFVTYHYLKAYHFSLWLFLFFGLIRVRKKVIPYELFVGSLVLFHLFSLSILTSSTGRFSVPIVPLTLFWAGAGILEIKRYLERMKISNSEKWIFSFMVLLILIQLPQSLIPERRHRSDQMKVGLWLKQNTPEGALIMSNSPIEAFYADREFIGLPPGISTPGNPRKSYNEIIHYAKTKGVGYVLVNKNTQEMNPGFVEAIQPTDLKEIFRRGDGTSLIYRMIY